MTSTPSVPIEHDPLDAARAVASERQPRTSMLDAPPSRAQRRVPVIAGAGTVGIHMLLVALATWVGTGIARKAAVPAVVTQMIEVELPPPPAPAPEPEPEPEPEPQRAVRAPAPPRARVEKPTEEAPPPAAAQAAQVVEAPAEVVDFGDRIVAGNAANYAGGVTEQGGTATQAVRDVNARAGGVVGGTGTDVNADRSRAPQLAGGAVWDCPFPVEADDAGLDHAVVGLRVEVSADGRVLSANAVKDPGHGFGREARRCALAKRWAPGLDRAGKAANAQALINVKFDR